VFDLALCVLKVVLGHTNDLTVELVDVDITVSQVHVWLQPIGRCFLAYFHTLG
jgi:hypothetical protein